MNGQTAFPRDPSATVTAGQPATPTTKRSKPAKAKAPKKERKKRTQDPAIAAIIAENKAKLEALKAEGKAATAKVRAELASSKRISRELHRLTKWSQEDNDRLLAALQTVATPPLPLPTP